MTDLAPSATLTGRLLVATPALGESTFERSVVLVLDHDEDGALGVVINRPTPVDVSEVLPVWQPLASEPGVLFQGGPVALDSALGLALVPGAGDDEPLGWRRVVGRIGLVDLDVPPEVLAAEVTRLRIFAGYSRLGLPDSWRTSSPREPGTSSTPGSAGSPPTTAGTPSATGRRTCGGWCCDVRAATSRWCRPTSTTRRSTEPRAARGGVLDSSA